MKKFTKITTVVLVAISMLVSQASLAIAQTTTVGSCSEATLHGYISPVGSPSSVWFEWSTNSSSVSSGNGNTTGSQTFSSASYFEKKISGLNENTTYYYRTASRNAKSTVYGEVSSFKTATCSNNNNDNGDNNDDGNVDIRATTNSATNITTSSARLNGYVSATGYNTARWFEWGTTSGDLSHTTGRASIYNSGDVSTTISGLSSDRTYYYRLVAENKGKTVYGEIRSFTTRDNGSDDNNNDDGDDYLSVSTRSATNVYSDSASLNGYVNKNGSNNVTRWFEWGRSSGDLDHTTSRITIGYSGNASAYISGLSRNTTYYYRIAARGNNGTQYGSTYSFTTTGSSYNDDNEDYNDGDRPSATTRSATGVDSNSASLNGYVDSNGGSNTYGWFEWGTSEGNLNRTSSKKYLGSSDSSIQTSANNLSADTTYYYRAVAENNQGTSRGSIQSFTTSRGNVVSNGSAPTPVTMLATNTSGSGATLNGLVLQTGGKSANAWFEWGTSMSLGRRTSSTNVGSSASVRHSEYLNGLEYGKTYYFRVVAENEDGRNYGIIRSFVAKPDYVAPVVKPVVKPVVIHKPTVKIPTKKPVSVVKTTTTVTERAVGESSLVMLTITGESDKIARGQNQTYTITWRNTSDQDLRNVVLRVIIPQTLSFESADDGTYSKVENTHTLLIGDLMSGEEGELNVALKGNSTLKNEDLVVTTANMVYTDEASIQGDALAYTTQKVSAIGSVLGASAGAASAPIAIIGWLILIILIVILAILIHNLYKRVSEKK